MNREILFRGFNEKNNKWLYGYYFVNRGQHFIAEDEIETNPILSEEDFAVNPNTIGQYTGFKDKNGRKIFEGDILEYIGKREDNMNKVYRRMVVFHEGMFALLSKELQAYSALKHHCMEDGRSAWRVIGNIHDNPELIE